MIKFAFQYNIENIIKPEILKNQKKKILSDSFIFETKKNVNVYI
jgi:hypothetical protein